MASALSSAYVLLGKASMSDPPDWSTAVGAIHTLSSLLTCTSCSQTINSKTSPNATPNDSFSLNCDKCFMSAKKHSENQEQSQQKELLKILMENIKNLCQYSVRAFHHVPKMEDSDDDSEIEIKDIVVVPPMHTSQGKFVSKLRKFADTYFQIIDHLPMIKEEKTQYIKSISTPPQTPKAVIVTSPVKTSSATTLTNGSWIKVHTPNPPKPKRSHVVINGSKFGRDQIIKTTLRPSLTYPFKATTKLTDFVVKLEELPKIINENSETTITTAVVTNKKGCRCGNATPTPGKLTCGGQRCPCYVGARSCLDCKCKGCRNPHSVHGIKVIRPHLQVKTALNSNNRQTNSTNKFYISTSATPLVTSQKSNSMTAIRRIHLN